MAKFQIRAEVDLEHLVKAQTAQRLRHLAGGADTGIGGDLLAQRHADGRSGLHDDELLGIGERIPNLALHGLARQRADRAGVDTLNWPHNALDTVYRHGLSERRADHGRIEPAVHRA